MFTVKISGKKGKNRKLPCFYCAKEVYKMQRHLESVHSHEKEVAKALAKQNGDKQLFLQKIMYTGIFRYNTSVLKSGWGELIVGRASDKQHIVEDYLPCTGCFVFLLRSELSRHKSVFKKLESNEHDEVEDEGRNKNLSLNSRLLLHGSLSDEKDVSGGLLGQHVLVRMQNDDLKKEAKQDELIMRMGAALLRKLGPRRANDISQIMRQLGRLRVQVKKLVCSANIQLSDYLTGTGFDVILDAVEAEGHQVKRL